MSDHGTIFSAPMVHSLLKGSKTETRRILRLPPDPDHRGEWEISTIGGAGVTDRAGQPFAARPCLWHAKTGACVATRYAAGDRLYVREAFRFWAASDDCEITYLADGRHFQTGPCTGEIPDASLARYFKTVNRVRKAGKGRNFPSIHMPRWASRLTLYVREVRIERLKAISRPAAIAEGLMAYPQPLGDPAWGVEGLPVEMQRIDPRQAYAQLWNSLHDKDGDRWQDDPWVTVTTFRVERHNIDRRPA